MPRLLHLTSAVWLVAMAVVPGAGAAEGSGEAPLEAVDEAAIAALFAQPAPDIASASGSSGVKFDTSWILDVAAAAFTEPEPRQLGGHDPAANGFTFQQLELALGGSIDTMLRFDGNLVFSLYGVEVEEAYATTTALTSRLQLRAGQFLTRFGRVNPTHPHAWSFIDQSLIIGKTFGSEGGRGLGIEASWLAPLPWYGLLTVSTHQAAGDCCSRSMAEAVSLDLSSPADLISTVRLEQFTDLTDQLGLSLGLSAQSGANGTGFGNRSDIFGIDLYLRRRDPADQLRRATSVTVEAIARRRQLPGRLLEDAGLLAQVVQGWSPHWESGARFETYTGVDEDPADSDWESARTRTTLQSTYFPSHFSRLRLQGSVDTAGGDGPEIAAVMLQLELVGGDHGSHSF